MVNVRTLLVATAASLAVAAPIAQNETSPESTAAAVFPLPHIPGLEAAGDLVHVIEIFAGVLTGTISVITKPQGTRPQEMQIIQDAITKLNAAIVQASKDVSNLPIIGGVAGQVVTAIVLNPIVHTIALVVEQIVAVVGSFWVDGVGASFGTVLHNLITNISTFIGVLAGAYPQINDDQSGLNAATSSLNSLLSSASA
ncbi:hypothetical protein B0I72DRAFT_146537 [Yarrowia lipolytica]|jgi:hypothetical protein|uniref:YALI0B02112p n=2 Tax=Yarrowia lipolytica TaxID=4952 RepID=Q6CG00_YARLI|nr:YALI0B02112p [Yarrowia lipolytica CLIB122]AOW01105.1 hypothetical protein YALI1_B03120g [Yarrowia lipolytica]KAB8281068.1 hypothetical protein BKA91DRAFT_148113 [Yarrowia lipolytica]KAE8172951.1 hypothetical protein BKA90DRAFT_82236 [Yarrowia lipolytica]KAJ8052004.1 hypothetical protein LXG23DRAFT_38065 [Yarrowia lipolytica]QNP95733.1 Hypothetical protein YALI2_B00038g [Yarrowia lipolytica]|eukprot:XP_500412.1 YALI0B02112p [Yarrowia lipolytica CLIB122]